MPKKSFDFHSRTNQVILDGCAFGLSFAAAYLIRFERWPGGPDLRQFLGWLPILVAVRLAVYVSLGVYRRVWKFVSFSDAIEIAKSIALISLGLAILRMTAPGQSALAQWMRIPYSVIALDGLLSIATSLGLRGLRRAIYARQRRTAGVSGGVPQRVLLYGAGRAGIMLLKELETNPAFDVIGFIDDEPKKAGSIIGNVRVVGNGEDLLNVAQKLFPDEVIISMATASPATLARALARCQRANVPAKIIPSLKEMLSGQVSISQLRHIRVEEILGRESVEVGNFEELAGSTYQRRRILVTGAGGSIGSELVRQLVRLAPGQIAILDKDENSIYELEQALKMRKPSVTVEAHIADIRDAGRLRAIVGEFRPELIFHAAAHKHVPLMESHPCEAVLNNVFGTRNILDLAEEFGVERFVFISSDKAVNPANIMGATKRIGELMVQASFGSKRTRFACVRFGNVLGSRGSVIPLFQQQIAAGGPVTVTDRAVVRYFMTIQEAVQLILCAGTMALGGETFVLDMGKPRNILELARQMILLSGMEPEIDIETKITGLRPGEKLTEELVGERESLRPTRFEKLSVIQPQPCDAQELAADICRLVQAAKINDSSQVRRVLQEMGLGPSSGTSEAGAATAHDRSSLGMRGQFQMAPPGVLGPAEPLQAD